MPKRISKKRQELDANEIAFRVVSEATEISPATVTISQVMAEMGRKGGKIGGKRSLETMTQAQRRKRAKKAAVARWKPKK